MIAGFGKWARGGAAIAAIRQCQVCTPSGDWRGCRAKIVAPAAETCLRRQDNCEQLSCGPWIQPPLRQARRKCFDRLSINSGRFGRRWLQLPFSTTSARTHLKPLRLSSLPKGRGRQRKARICAFCKVRHKNWYLSTIDIARYFCLYFFLRVPSAIFPPMTEDNLSPCIAVPCVFPRPLRSVVSPTRVEALQSVIASPRRGRPVPRRGKQSPCSQEEIASGAKRSRNGASQRANNTEAGDRLAVEGICLRVFASGEENRRCCLADT